MMVKTFKSCARFTHTSSSSRFSLICCSEKDIQPNNLTMRRMFIAGGEEVMSGQKEEQCVGEWPTFSDFLYAGIGTAQLCNLGVASQSGNHAWDGRKKDHEPQPDECATLILVCQPQRHKKKENARRTSSPDRGIS
jgi:hypothetical protein